MCGKSGCLGVLFALSFGFAKLEIRKELAKEIAAHKTHSPAVFW